MIWAGRLLFHALFCVMWPSKSRRIFLTALGRECSLNASTWLMGPSGTSGCDGVSRGREQSSTQGGRANVSLWLAGCCVERCSG